MGSAVTYAGDQNLLLEASPQKANGVYGITDVPVDSIETRIAKIISVEDIGHSDGW